MVLIVLLKQMVDRNWAKDKSLNGNEIHCYSEEAYLVFMAEHIIL